MAVALGVADKVIEQLKVAMPELIDDPDFMPIYYWYYIGQPGVGSPADVFSGAIHDASVAAIANSVDASGSGGEAASPLAEGVALAVVEAAVRSGVGDR